MEKGNNDLLIAFCKHHHLQFNLRNVDDAQKLIDDFESTLPPIEKVALEPVPIVEHVLSPISVVNYDCSALKEGETYCKLCKQVIKNKNLVRHDNSIKHEKMVFNSVKEIIMKKKN